MFDNGDALLFALSAWRETSWSTFKKSFDGLHRRDLKQTDASKLDAGLLRWRTIRTLMCLGHVDVSFENTTAIVIASPSLVALPGPGVRRAILCGARSAALVEKLRAACSGSGAVFEMQSQRHLSPFAPSRFEVQAESHDCIRSLAGAIGATYLEKSPARTIARWAASLKEYLDALVWTPDDSLNWYRKDFAPSLLRFSTPAETTAATRLSRYQDPATTLWRYRLHREGSFAAVDPDWGRYAILAIQKQQVFEFDAANKYVTVPSKTPLPVLFSRALALCSGYAPKSEWRDDKTRGRGEYFDHYLGIPPSVFDMVSGKLGQGA